MSHIARDPSSSAPAQPGQEAGPEFFVWSFPGLASRILLKLSIIPALRKCLTGNDVYSSESVEVAGLLLGTASSSRVHITDFHPIIRQSTSPRFLLTENEKSHFRSTIQKWNTRDNGVSVVGYYRTSLTGRIQLGEDDLALIKECFREPTNVFLVVGMASDNGPTGGFFFWDAGSVFAEATYMPFPLDERLLAVPV